MSDDPWSDAKTIEELAELTAQWLEGRVEGHPSGYDLPDQETELIRAPLIAMNRTGYFTDHSQPGVAEGWGDQRANVSGYCNQGLASRLVDAGTFSDLIVLAHPPGSDASAPIPVTRSPEGPHTIANNYWSDGMTWPTLSSDAQEAIRQAWYVEVLDATWGRNNLLWPTIVAALEKGPLTTRSLWFSAEDLGHG